MLNKNLLKATLVASGKTVRDAAMMIGCSESSFYRKMNGYSDFTRNEIQLLKKCFAMSQQEVEQIFFA